MMHVQDAAVVLHLRIRLKPGMLKAFFDYARGAFPVFEASCDCNGIVYADAQHPEAIDAVFDYRTEDDYQLGERLIAEDPAQVALLERWRSLLDGLPRVEVQWRISPIP
jgi:hypothetical protein